MIGETTADPQGLRSLLAIWRALIELGCSPAEIRHGLSYPDGDFERCVADGISVGIDKKTLDVSGKGRHTGAARAKGHHDGN